jgi:hypothetical protein
MSSPYDAYMKYYGFPHGNLYSSRQVAVAMNYILVRCNIKKCVSNSVLSAGRTSPARRRRRHEQSKNRVFALRFSRLLRQYRRDIPPEQSTLEIETVVTAAKLA